MKLFNKLSTNHFLKSVLTLSSGIAIGQLINLVGMPIVSRLYEPEALGLYTLLTTNSSLISSVACLGMMTSFMLPERDEEARGLCQLVTKSTCFISMTAMLLLFLFQNHYKLVDFSLFSYEIYLLLIFINIMLTTVSSICYSYANRFKLYKVMFWNPVFTALFHGIFRVLLFYLGFRQTGYLYAAYISTMINILHLLRHANPYVKVEDPQLKNLPLLKQYIRFPKYQMPANLVSSMEFQIPIRGITFLYGDSILGMYSMSMRIIGLPVTFLASPINRVYFQEASHRYQNNEDISEFTFNILKANIKLAIVPICFLIIFGETLFACILGENWRMAGQFATILASCELMRFCSSCISGGFIIIGKKKISLILSLAKLSIKYIFVFFSTIFLSNQVFIFLWCNTIIDCFFIILTLGIYFKYIQLKIYHYITFLFQYFFIPCSISAIINMIIFS